MTFERFHQSHNKENHLKSEICHVLEFVGKFQIRAIISNFCFSCFITEIEIKNAMYYLREF